MTKNYVGSCCRCLRRTSNYFDFMVQRWEAQQREQHSAVSIQQSAFSIQQSALSNQLIPRMAGSDYAL
jgi:hypothetical protein